MTLAKEASRAPRIGFNVAPVDRFTLGHMAVGVILGLRGVPWWVALGITVGWELIEDPLKSSLPGIFPHASHDAPINSIIDGAAVMLGWAMMRALPEEPMSRWT